MTQEIYPGPKEFGREAIGLDPILKFFHYEHLPDRLKEISAPFCQLAGFVAELPRNAERSTALRKLLEAKDAAVRASLGDS